MIECRHCREFIRGNPKNIGARCPRCRMPLYEKLHTSRRPGGSAGACAVHPANQAVGPCQSCGALLCVVCRTRWRDQALCLSCAERAIATRDTAPEDVKGHSRQAILSLLFAMGGWVLFVLGGLAVSSAQSGPPSYRLAIFGALIILMSLLPALFGIGQAAAAIRIRGSRMSLATFGLVIAGCQVGIMIGFTMLNIWHN